MYSPQWSQKELDSLQGLPSQNPARKALTITFLCSVCSHSEVLLFFDRVVALHLYRYCLVP